MCGIFAICYNGAEPSVTAEQASQMSIRQKHRGPDCRGCHLSDKAVLYHERLSIVDLVCKQPIAGSTEGAQVVHNGEIYNHGLLRKTELKEFSFRTHCDSEVIVLLHEKYNGDGQTICNKLDGVFAFALIDGDKFMAGRDPIGVKPLYYGKDKENRYYFSSEMKVIQDLAVESLDQFPPGHFWTPASGFQRFYEPIWFNPEKCHEPLEITLIRDALINSTEKRLMADVPLGVLLSGGLDSSLISSIAVRCLSGAHINSFSIGLDEHAPDLQAARKVAAFLGTKHHEFHFTVEQGIANIENLVHHLETYDVTTIRASTPMYFLSKQIKEMGIKVVLSGEGADEIFGGYLYFHNAPDDKEFQEETIRRVRNLYLSDCLRADKSCMANGLEVRVPFLDKKFLEVAMSLAPEFKRPQKYEANGRPIEKYILRKAFDDAENPYLPHEILWRQKEQFSDGVGYNWIDQLMDYCSQQVTDEEFAQAEALFPHNTPHNKEAFYIRRIFHKYFPSENAAHTVYKWVPRWQLNQDPSGRASKVHLQSIKPVSAVPKLNGQAVVEHQNGFVTFA